MPRRRLRSAARSADKTEKPRQRFYPFDFSLSPYSAFAPLPSDFQKKRRGFRRAA
jgi:hypothetical protein